MFIFSINIDIRLLTFLLMYKVPLDVLIQDKSSYRYDPLYGFLTNDTNKYQQTLFECFFKKGNKHQTAFVNLVVESKLLF